MLKVWTLIRISQSSYIFVENAFAKSCRWGKRTLNARKCVFQYAGYFCNLISIQNISPCDAYSRDLPNLKYWFIDPGTHLHHSFQYISSSRIGKQSSPFCFVMFFKEIMLNQYLKVGEAAGYSLLQHKFAQKEYWF